jgi:hypothetical protein
MALEADGMPGYMPLSVKHRHHGQGLLTGTGAGMGIPLTVAAAVSTVARMHDFILLEGWMTWGVLLVVMSVKPRQRDPTPIILTNSGVTKSNVGENCVMVAAAPVHRTWR